MTTLRWGLPAAGTIAAEFAAGVEQSRYGVLGTVAAHVADRQAPELTGAETLASLRTLDRWRSAVGYGG